MKPFIKLLSLALLLCTAFVASSQTILSTATLKTAPDYFYKVDSTTNSQTIYITQSKAFEKVSEPMLTTWTVFAEEASDTTTFTITVEQAVDRSYTRWVPTFTVATNESTLGTDLYMFAVPQLGYRQRLKIVATGTSTKTRYYTAAKTAICGALPSLDGVLLN